MTLGEMTEIACAEPAEVRAQRRIAAWAAIVRIGRIQLARDLADDREARRFGWLDLGGEAGGA